MAPYSGVGMVPFNGFVSYLGQSPSCIGIVKNVHFLSSSTLWMSILWLQPSTFDKITSMYPSSSLSQARIQLFHGSLSDKLVYLNSWAYLRTLWHWEFQSCNCSAYKNLYDFGLFNRSVWHSSRWASVSSFQVGDCTRTLLRLLQFSEECIWAASRKCFWGQNCFV